MTGIGFDKGIECSRTGRDENSEREKEKERGNFIKNNSINDRQTLLQLFFLLVGSLSHFLGFHFSSFFNLFLSIFSSISLLSR